MVEISRLKDATLWCVFGWPEGGWLERVVKTLNVRLTPRQIVDRRALSETKDSFNSKICVHLEFNRTIPLCAHG
jgi:hypothetical protein